MDTKNKNNEELIRKFMADTYSDDELLDLFEQVNTNQLDQTLASMLPNDLENIEPTYFPSDEIESNYGELREIIGIASSKKLRLTRFAKYAAIFTLPLLMGLLSGFLFFGNKNDKAEMLSFVIEKGNKGFVELGDGSKVWLNSNSQLVYDANNPREVKLEGEAYFEVAQNAEKQFKVQTNAFDIVVYGTAFNVSNYQTDQMIEVALVEGSIGISSEGQSLFKLSPGQSALYSKADKHYTIVDKDMTDISLWKNRELIIRDLNAEQLFKKLSAWYGFDISTLNKDPNKVMYNLVISNESLENILDLIGKLSPMEYKIEGKEVTVRYK